MVTTVFIILQRVIPDVIINISHALTEVCCRSLERIADIILRCEAHGLCSSVIIINACLET